jgi:hypothetical protein
MCGFADLNKRSLPGDNPIAINADRNDQFALLIALQRARRESIMGVLWHTTTVTHICAWRHDYISLLQNQNKASGNVSDGIKKFLQVVDINGTIFSFVQPRQ